MSHQQTAKVGASIIFVNEQGQLLLMKRSKHCFTFPNHWGLVGGFIEPGETPQEGAIREAKEEIGVDIEIIKFVGRYYNTPHTNYKNTIALPHYAKIVSGTPHTAQPEECSDVKWFTPEDIREMDLAYDHKQILEDEGLI